MCQSFQADSQSRSRRRSTISCSRNGERCRARASSSSPSSDQPRWQSSIGRSTTRCSRLATRDSWLGWRLEPEERGVFSMSLMKKISEDMTAAMRAKDQGRLAPLRMAKAALMNREVEKGRELDEAESQQVIASLIKQRRDSAEQFEKGGRPELAARETAEISTLEAYLPPPI